MRVAIGARVKDEPWGGGNRFAISLLRYLRSKGAEVSHDLSRPDLDIILLTEPRRSSASSAFNDADIFEYLTTVNPRSLVVHRVNECDERKNTRFLNRRLMIANRCADKTVFVSNWLHKLFLDQGYHFVEPSVVLNGADQSLFHSGGAPAWDGHGRLKIVTHHWSDNWLKGFDIYQRFDDLLGQGPYGDLFEFTYIGRVSPTLTFRHVRLLGPLSGVQLADALRSHHVYLTASRNEPGAMHPIEGGLCGLPILYRRSGATPEYCEGFGMAFDEHDFEKALLKMRDEYSNLRQAMPDYPYHADRMCRTYEEIFQGLLARRDEVLGRRRWNVSNARILRMRAGLYDAAHRWLLKTQPMRGVRFASREAITRLAGQPGNATG